MSDLTIRRAVDVDAATIAAFNTAMAKETEGLELLPDVIGAGVRELFAHPERGFYLVAEDGASKAVVASLLVTYEWSDWRNGMFWWIQSVFVTPEFRRQGIYRRMYEKVKALAAAEPDVCGFRLYVELENTRAQKAYEELGMHAAPYRMYEELKDGVKYHQ